MRVYHRTSPEACARIVETGEFHSLEGTEVCVSNRANGYATSYGTAYVTLILPASVLRLDDEFQTGERHYRVDASDIPASAIVATGGAMT